jgi:2-polyprenyl-6-methoxyphenol hydroxylase-like FAD-dependent oxidoreductase
MTQTKNVLISGASVAGPALAFWLRRFGFHPTVVERAPALRPGGQAVDFRGPVHLTVLRRMGLLDEIHEHRTSPKKWVFVDRDGTQKASLPADFAGGEVEIRRGDLSLILYQATRERTEYIFGDWITSLTETPDGVDVTFDKGVSRRFDLVIGADGMHSGVRALAFGPESEHARFMGSYFASFGVPDELTRDPDLLIFNAPRLFVSPGLFVFRSERLDYDRNDVDEQKRIVADLYRGAGWRTEAIVEAMLAAPDFYLDSISHITMERFTRGRFALLGDAAWGTTLGGMGTGMGMVGAYLLAGELAEAGGNHEVAFAKYQEQMRPYSKGTQGDAGKFLAPATNAKIWQRNQIFKLINTRPVLKLIGRFDLKVASNLELKNYAE